MANQDKENKNGTNAGEGTPETGATEQTTVVTVPQKTGVGTAVKIVVGLTGAAVFTGLGWLLRGIFGGGRDDDGPDASNEAPTEE